MINQFGNEIDEDSSHIMETCDKRQTYLIMTDIRYPRTWVTIGIIKKLSFLILHYPCKYLMKNMLIIHENIISKKSI